MIDTAPDFSDGNKRKICEGCDTRVYNLSALTQEDAEAFLAGQDNICISYRTDDSGAPAYLPKAAPGRSSPALAGSLTVALSMAAACGVKSDVDATPQTVEPTTEASSETTKATQTTAKSKRAKVGKWGRPKRPDKAKRRKPKQTEKK